MTFDQFAITYRTRVHRQMRNESIMDGIMIAVAAAAMLAFMAIAAHAGVTCSQVGETMFCTDTDTGQTWTCFRLGNQTICN